MKTVQYFSDEYLEHCRKLSPDQIAQFLEDFRLMNQQEGKSKLISIKIPENLLRSFRIKCELSGSRYQTQIKELMREWIYRG